MASEGVFSATNGRDWVIAVAPSLPKQVALDASLSTSTIALTFDLPLLTLTQPKLAG